MTYLNFSYFFKYKNIAVCLQVFSASHKPPKKVSGILKKFVLFKGQLYMNKLCSKEKKINTYEINGKKEVLSRETVKAKGKEINVNFRTEKYSVSFFISINIQVRNKVSVRD